MSIFKKIAAAVFGAAPVSDIDKAVAGLRNTSVGKAVVADITALADRSLTGTEKFEAVVANTLPLLADFVSTDSRKLAIKEVEDIGRALVQSVFNAVVSKKAGTVAASVMKLLGIK